MKAVLSEKGQVTIPKPLRDRLGLRPGQILEFEIADGALVGRKEVTGDAASVFGIIRPGLTTDEMMTLLRGEPEA